MLSHGVGEPWKYIHAYTVVSSMKLFLAWGQGLILLIIPIFVRYDLLIFHLIMSTTVQSVGLASFFIV